VVTLLPGRLASNGIEEGFGGSRPPEIKQVQKRAGSLVKGLVADASELPVVLNKAQYRGLIRNTMVHEIDGGVSILRLSVRGAPLVDCRPALPGSAQIERSRRISSQRLQHPLLLDALQAPLQKIDLPGRLADLALQPGDAAFRPAPGSVARKRVAWPAPELPSPAVQDVGIDLRLFGLLGAALRNE
jgi:hypothetical protein